MKTKRPFPNAELLLLATLLLCAVVPAPSSFAQGSLTPPPGSPAPTMKTLQQVEPRADLQATPAPAGVDTTNASYDFIINQPGSYYLSANLVVAKANGIKINVEGVTLDLNGFHIFRGGGSGGNGIEIAANAHRATVRNGEISGFARGIQSISAGGFARSCSLERLAVSNCTDIGIFAGDGTVLESCRVHNNTGSAGIDARSGCMLRNCAAGENSGIGILVGSGSSLTNCTALLNGSAGISTAAGCTLIGCTASFNKAGHGIFAGEGSSVIHCTANQNTSAATESAGIATGEGCTVVNSTSRSNISTASSTSSTGMGFDLGPGSTIRGCTATRNEGNGIRLSSDCIAVQNLSDENGIGTGDGAGIHANSSDSRIEGNNVTDNDRGIHASVAGNLIIKNSAANNTTNYEIVQNNFYGEIKNSAAASPTPPAVGGSSAASSIGTTDPWANISF